MMYKNWWIHNPFKWYSGEPFVIFGFRFMHWDRANRSFTFIELNFLKFSLGFGRFDHGY